MTSKPLWLAGLAICLQSPLAQAQDAAAASRAERDASNPLRMIIEASKLKPRQKAAEPEAAPKATLDKGVVRAPAAKPAAPAVAPPSTASPPAASAERLPALALAGAIEPLQAAVPPSVEQTPPPAVVEAAPHETAVEPPASPTSATPAPEPTQATALPATVPPPIAVPTAAPSTTGPTADSRPPATPTASTQVALAAPSPPQPEPATVQAPGPAARVSLQLADYVEPVLPDRLRRRLQGEGVVVVKFTVNPDGSVADVAVRSSSDRALDPIALDAVGQWRYKPIAAAQAHAVELVFKNAN